MCPACARRARTQGARPQAVLLLGQHYDAAAFRRLVGQRGELRRLSQLPDGRPCDGRELHGLPVAQRNRPRLVQQEHVDVACGFNRSSRCGDHIAPDHAVHARDADGRQQPADGRWDQAHQQRHQHRDGQRSALARGPCAIDRKRQERGADHEKDDRETGQQNAQCNLVRSFLPSCAFHHRDHAFKKAVTWLRRHAHHQPIRKQASTAGDGAAVTAGLAHHGRALAGHCAFVHRSDAFEDLAIRGQHIAGLHQVQIASPESAGGCSLDAAIRPVAGAHDLPGLRIPPGPAQRIRLCFAAPFRQRLREVGEQHREPEPACNGQGEASLPGDSPKCQHRHPEGAHLCHKHNGVAHLASRVKLGEGI